ncbi:MAG TPA: NHL repeat-containing protein [Pyrinomonadaceae bacterium]|jgi:sugar lactone lactonase YvrE
MLKRITIFFSVVLLICALGFIVLRLRRPAPPTPTVAGWHANVSTLAGDGTPLWQDAATFAQARFADPFGLALAPDGTLYLTDGGDSNRIRKLAPTGAVTTLAGSTEGYADGPATSAAFNTPSGLAIDDAGNLYVADTGNNRIRKVAPNGAVTTIAGDGTAGYADGAGAAARFNAPVGVAAGHDGRIYVADTYNDRIRLITPDGQVTTLAGGDRPGYADGQGTAALFDTPCAVAVNAQGELIVADTGNNRLRKIRPDGQVSTISTNAPAANSAPDEQAHSGLAQPTGLALTHDGFIYVTEVGRGRITQVAPDGTVRVIAGRGSGFADGDGLTAARFNQPAGITVDRAGALYVADGANYLVRKLTPVVPGAPVNTSDTQPALPRLTPETLGLTELLWPLDPQRQPHEVSATMGEVRGSYDSTDSRDHLHSGIDVFGVYGQTVRVVRPEKVAGALCNWGFGGLNEGLRVGVVSYIHLRVGRDEQDAAFADARFIAVRDDKDKLMRVRVRRGTRFHVGDALGTINRMYHVHLNTGPPGGEINPLGLAPIGFGDHIAPQIERDGVQLFDDNGQRFAERRAGRLVVARTRVRIVVDAYDRTDGNQARRRLGLYRLGYQLLNADGSPAEGFAAPRLNIEFARLPPDDDAPKIAYADASGITVYGSKETKFFYEVTNIVRDGRAAEGRWDASAMPPGDYTLRIIAADLAGNEATNGRDLLIHIE